MIKKICAVYDTQAKVYAAPFPMASIGEAVRAFGDAVNDRSSGTLNKHPKDFILYEIASWDDNSGEFISIIPPNRLALGSDFVVAVNGVQGTPVEVK